MTGRNIKVISRYRDSFRDSGYLWASSGTDRSNCFQGNFVGRDGRPFEDDTNIRAVQWPDRPSAALRTRAGTRRIILVDYCGITWVHTCAPVGRSRTSYLYAVEYTYVFVSYGFSMETLARGRACCDTLIPKSVAISPRYNK